MVLFKDQQLYVSYKNSKAVPDWFSPNSFFRCCPNSFYSEATPIEPDDLDSQETFLPDSAASQTGALYMEKYLKAFEALKSDVSVNYNSETCRDKHLFVRMQLDAEWFNEGSPCKPSKNQFITLQVALMGDLRNRKLIFEHPDWRKRFPESPPASELHRLSSRPHQSILPPWEDASQTGALAASLNGLLPYGAPYMCTYVKLPDWPDPPQGGTALLLHCTRSSQMYTINSTEFDSNYSGELYKKLKELMLQMHVFWSFGDITAFFGRHLSKHIADRLITRKTLRFKQRWINLPLVVKDRFGVCRRVKLQIVDWYGIEYQSLKQTCLAYNVRMEAKDLMDGFKTRMHEAYRNPDTRPDFVEYALSDLCIADLEDAYKSNFKVLCKLAGVFSEDDDSSSDPRGDQTRQRSRQGTTPLSGSQPGLSPDIYKGEKTSESSPHGIFHVRGSQRGLRPDTYKQPPMTKGAKVAMMFRRFLEKLCVVSEDFHEIADLRDRAKQQSITDLMKVYGCQQLLESDPALTKRHLAIVQGGRIKHELPTLSLFCEEPIISMDLQSCYGMALINLFVPVGHPSLIYFPINRPSDWMPLGKFLKKFGHELVDLCWYAVIDTCDEQLSFSQNLIYSKYLNKADSPERKHEAHDNESFTEDDSHIKGQFMLLEKEIKNGILTSTIMSILKNVCSSQEWGELMRKIHIKAAMIYPRSQMMEYEGAQTFVKWQEALRKHPRRLTTIFDISGHCVQDRRPGPWVKFPLKTFISPLVEARMKFKGEMKSLRGDPNQEPEYYKKDAMQRALKGVINTVYGVLASPYFPISSPCAANNITAMARAATLLMASSSGGIKSITDGTECCLNKFRFSRIHNPSMNTISLLGQPHLLPDRTRYRIKIAPLGSQGDPKVKWDWTIKGGEVYFAFKGQEYPFKEAVKLIEKLYKEHLFDFFRFSRHLEELEWARRFGIECKVFGYGYASHGLADYLIGSFKGEGRAELIKARGHKLYDTHYDPNTELPMQSPMKTILENLFEGRPLQARIQSNYTKPCSSGEYLTRVTLRDQGILPGDTITKTVRPKLITVSEFAFQTLNSRLSYEKYYNYMNRVHGCGLEGPYLDEQGYLKDIDQAKSDIQHRIRQGCGAARCEAPGKSPKEVRNA